MPCKQWNDGWVAQLYGELEPAEERALAAHLERCAACKTTLEELRASHELLQEASPEVPAAPRVVVLRPRSIWSNAWAFAAGAACALFLFGLGFMAGPRWTATGDDSSPQVAQADTTQIPTSPEPVSIGETTPVLLQTTPELQDGLFALEQRLTKLEEQPSDDALTPALLREELDRLERRFNQERVRDLEYVIRSLTASELRTGTWMDQTQDAITMLALRQDPRFNER
jgi:hypothetical protein